MNKPRLLIVEDDEGIRTQLRYALREDYAVSVAEDRAQAWEDLMLKASLPAGAKDCANPIDKNRQLMRRFGIRGTPAIYLEDGRHIGGYLQARQIEQALNSVKK